MHAQAHVWALHRDVSDCNVHYAMLLVCCALCSAVFSFAVLAGIPCEGYKLKGNCLLVLQDAMQQSMQQAVQQQKQKGDSEQRAAISQLNLDLQQTRQQLADAKKDANTVKLEADSLKR